MIPRYSQGQISKIWTDKNRYEIWFQIEVLVCEKLYIDKKISKKDFLQIKDILDHWNEELANEFSDFKYIDIEKIGSDELVVVKDATLGIDQFEQTILL